MIKYHFVAKDVEPKRIALKQSQVELDELTQRLNKLRAELQSRIRHLVVERPLPYCASLPPPPPHHRQPGDTFTEGGDPFTPAGYRFEADSAHTFIRLEPSTTHAVSLALCS